MKESKYKYNYLLIEKNILNDYIVAQCKTLKECKEKQKQYKSNYRTIIKRERISTRLYNYIYSK